MNEDDAKRIRAQVEAELKSPMRDVTWDFFVKRGYMQDIVIDPDSQPGVVEAVRDFEDALEKDRTERIHRKQTVKVTATPPELSRQKVAAEALAGLAAGERRVRVFRREFVAGIRPGKGPRGGRMLLLPDGTAADRNAIKMSEFATLSPDEAWNFLASPAAGVLAREDLEKFGVHPLRHRSTEIKKSQAKDKQATQYTFCFDVEGRKPFEKCWEAPSEPDQHFVNAILPTREGKRECRRVRGQSVLGQLREVSTVVTAGYPWEEPDAAWFLLTGEPPERPPIEAGFEVDIDRQRRYSTARISLSIDATMSLEEVTKHYADVRRRVLPGRPRLAEERALEVFRFVNQRRNRDPGRTWGDLVEEWDRTCQPDWSFGGNQKWFRTYWGRAKDTVFPKIDIEGSTLAMMKEDTT